MQDIFTKAEQIDEKSKIFADASNESVRESMGVADAATADANIKAANKALYGVEDSATDAADLKAKIDAGKDKTNSATKALYDAVKDGDTTADSLVNDIVKYNLAMDAAGTADKKIDTAALKDYITIGDATQAATGNKFNTANGGNVTDQLAFMKALSSDANYKNMVSDGTYAKAQAADGAYTGYNTAKTAYDNAHTALVDSATVGIDAAGDKVNTASGEKGISITANKEGIGGQISGFNISITDSKGNVKKSANAALDAFSETVRAQNKSDDNAISLQVGAAANQSIKVGLTDMRAEALGLKGDDGTTLNISTQKKANAAINVLDNAIQKALDQQTTIGSVESRLEYTSSNLTTASENVQASESTIRDADMAKEMTNYTKNNVLLQAAQSMLAQANQSSSNVLSLLQ